MSGEATYPTTELVFPTQYRVRIKDSVGELHNVLAYGDDEDVARENGLRQAQRLLKDPACVVMWIKRG